MRVRSRRYPGVRSTKVFKASELTANETEINELMLKLAKVCEGKKISLVCSALEKLQSLTY